jgi:hypothetical protein
MGLPALLLISGLAAAGARDEGAHLPSPALLTLPGMRPAPTQALPMGALPIQILSDVTNAPNPFDSRKSGLEGQTRLSWTLSADYPVTITLYDLLGFEVRSWRFRPGEAGARAGENALWWDGRNASGQKGAKGGYLAQIEAETPNGVATAVRRIGLIH